jgi:DNA-directed RNA polymerase specialized sigma24 family protein
VAIVPDDDFDDFYKRVSPIVYGTMRRYLAWERRADVEALTQDVMCKMYEHWNRYRRLPHKEAPHNLAGWLR